MTDDFKLQASIKDHDGDMVNFRANSPDELASEFQLFPYADYAAAKAALRGSGAAAPIVQPAAPVQQPPANNGWPQQPQQQAAPVQQGPRLHPEGKTCDICGNVLQFKDVYSQKKQKSFRFWECPQRNGANSPHTSVFAN